MVEYSTFINNIKAFFLSTGDFCFIGNQYPLDIIDDGYRVDLLLYHKRMLRRVAIDIYIGEFEPEYVGKMQYCLTVLDETIKPPGENPPIGIIICKSKTQMTVEYTLKGSNNPIGVMTYDDLPESMRSFLPSPAEIVSSESCAGDVSRNW